MTWRPIETAPRPVSDDGWQNWTAEEYVLVYDPEIGVRGAACTPVLEYPETTHGPAVLAGWQWWTGDAYDSDLLNPTHWMPLPPPPEASE